MQVLEEIADDCMLKYNKGSVDKEVREKAAAKKLSEKKMRATHMISGMSLASRVVPVVV